MTLSLVTTIFQLVIPSFDHQSIISLVFCSFVYPGSSFTIIHHFFLFVLSCTVKTGPKLNSYFLICNWFFGTLKGATGTPGPAGEGGPQGDQVILHELCNDILLCKQLSK